MLILEFRMIRWTGTTDQLSYVKVSLGGAKFVLLQTELGGRIPYTVKSSTEPQLTAAVTWKALKPSWPVHYFKFHTDIAIANSKPSYEILLLSIRYLMTSMRKLS